MAMRDADLRLDKHAEAAGLEREWIDADGRRQRVADDDLRAILAALGQPACSDGEATTSLAGVACDAVHNRLVVLDSGKPSSLPGLLPGSAELLLEDGSSRLVRIGASADGALLSAIAEPGYHGLRQGSLEVAIAVAPPRCPVIADRLGGRRGWGAAVQVPALVGDRLSTHGDFAALADAARHFARAGADALAISPTHALFPGDPDRYSPYAPSSRLFHNILLAAPPAPAGPPCTPAELIDWRAASADRLKRLREAFAARSDDDRAAVAAFVDAHGAPLLVHATFDALHAHFHAAQGAPGWPDWPAAFQAPDSPAVAAFVAAHRADVDFFLYAQWLADRELAASQAAALTNGMAIGLIADLAVGIDRRGSHGWSGRAELLEGLSVGAPPDPLGPLGQNWGITSFSPAGLSQSGYRPFIAMLRTALRHAGGVRIDHAFGLQRLWVVPDGYDASHGAYLRMPRADLLRLVALEAYRANAIVIGEDLGTVPAGFREALHAHGIAGMRLLPFERDNDGRFLPPSTWSADAVAMTGTHDLPTLAGWWRGRDIDWRTKLERMGNHQDEVTLRREREEDRDRLWAVAGRQKPRPAADDPVPLVDAALAMVAATPAPLLVVPAEDLLACEEQPNLPGTVDEHPNWRRRLPESTGTWLSRPPARRRIALIAAARHAG
jgi:4-alpha-glucanotransferase